MANTPCKVGTCRGCGRRAKLTTTSKHNECNGLCRRCTRRQYYYASEGKAWQKRQVGNPAVEGLLHHRELVQKYFPDD